MDWRGRERGKEEDLEGLRKGKERREHEQKAK